MDTVIGRAGGLIIGVPGIVGHVASHGRSCSRDRSHRNHPRRRRTHQGFRGGSPVWGAGTHHWLQGRVSRVGCRHHASMRRTWETGGGGITAPTGGVAENGAGAESRRCFVSQVLGLLCQPFLVLVFHVLLVFPTAAVCLPHRRRIMGKTRITTLNNET